MVKIGLQLRAQLEKVTNLAPEGEDFRWYIKLKCANCGDETPDFVYLNIHEKQPIRGSRGEANMVIKCKLCGRENSIDIIHDSIKPYTADDGGRFKTIIAFDCRGVEPTDFDPRMGWACEGEESGAKFPEVDLSQKDWSDYDEKANESVGIYEVESKFVKV